MDCNFLERQRWAVVRVAVTVLFLVLVASGYDGSSSSSQRRQQTLRVSWLHGGWRLWNEPLTTAPYLITHIDFTTTPATGKNAFRAVVNMTVYRSATIGDKTLRFQEGSIDYVGIGGEYRIQVEPDEIDMYIPIPTGTIPPF